MPSQQMESANLFWTGRKHKFAAGCALSILASAGMIADESAKAAEQSVSTISEIIVTAQRRAENLQDVPIAVSAITSEDLVARGIGRSQDLAQLVPALTITTQSGYFFPRLRGIGNEVIGPGFENGVAAYVDGVFIGSTPAGIMSLNNIERIEVLKGPQGTLFGRNATGGLIQVITRKPQQDPAGEVSIGYGNYQTVTADAYVTGGLSDTVAVDFAGHISHQGDGYGTNIANGQDINKTDKDIALRSSALFTPTDNTMIRISGDYSYTKGSMFARQAAPGSIPAFPNLDVDSVWDAALNYNPLNRFESWGITGHIDQELGFAQLTSITAYRETENFSGQDGDGTYTPAINVLLNQKDRQFSQELQLKSNADTSFSWIAGAYYFHGLGKFDPARVEFFGPFSPPTPLGPLAADITYAQLKTDALAAFAQATMPITDETNLTMGFRYTTEKRSISAQKSIDIAGGPIGLPDAPVPDQSKRFSKATWRISLDHRLSDQLMVYASYNRGFKSGGFNGASPTAPAFLPEVLDAFEVGLKSDLFARRFRLNMAAFYYDYKNIQVSRYTLAQTIIYNGAAARVYGLDAEFEARLTPELTLTGGISLIDDKFTDFPNASFYVPLPTGGNQVIVQDGTGNRLPQTAHVAGHITADYRIPTSFGEIGLIGTYSYNDGYYSQPDNILYQPRYSFINASMIVRFEKGYELQIWGRNLANKEVTSSLASSNFASAASYMPPRTYGATVRAKF